MISKFPTNSRFFSRLRGFFRNLLFGISRFFSRTKTSVFMLSKPEKAFVLILLCALIVLSGIKTKHYYYNVTNAAPDFGGSYKEAVAGEVRYLNPILTTTDAEKSVASLIFSSLFKYDGNGDIIPDAANKWEISPDKLNYTVTLKDNIYFHDGEKLTANDVAYTIMTIQDPNFKSPLYEIWKDTNVSVTAENVVVFELPRAYGPFTYNLDFGILPQHLSSDDFSKTIIGSGPYKYFSVKKKDEKISQLKLVGNEQYYFGRPYIDKIELDFFDQKDAALSGFQQNNNYQALSGANIAESGFANLSYPTTKKLVLIPNLRTDKFKNKDIRAQVLSSDQKLPDKIKITMVTADAEIQRSKAEELTKSYAERNIELEVKYLKPTEMSGVLSSKNYELLLYGFDFGHDRDPYLFWHSSQMEKMNYAGYSDKNADILLEDARMITDPVARSAKYDKFSEIIKSESLAVYYDPVRYNFSVSNAIKGIVPISRCDADSKYLGVGKWYIEEKRVRK